MVELSIDIPATFLDEEVRCGYTITSKMKEVWAIEIDLLQQLINVCEKYNLRYYALGGTLLGAIRHHGFIPWDDDIDVLMPRSDYNTLIEIGEQEFSFPYFLSSTRSEFCFWRRFIRLRNSNTTGATSGDVYLNDNKGIFIDILPLDEVPSTEAERNLHRKRIRRVSKWADRKCYADQRIGRNKTIENIVKYIISSLFIHSDHQYKNSFQKFNEELSSYSGKDTGFLAHASMSYLENRVWPKDWYSSTKLIDFEFTKIAVPNEYMKILVTYFGDRCMEIPNEYPPSCHQMANIDTDKPFTDYYKLKTKER